MNFDLRLPLGLLFSIFGLVLSIFGALSDKALYDRSLGINVNLDWGLVLLAFGLWMLTMALKARSKRKHR